MGNLLGIRLMALRGRKTRMVRIADRFMFSKSRQYSTALRFHSFVHSIKKGEDEVSLYVRKGVVNDVINRLPGDDDEAV